MDYLASCQPFVQKTFQLVQDSTTDHIVSWSESKDSFVIFLPEEFSKVILPKYFKHSNLSSFVRQLNFYGWKKVENASSQANRIEFRHELFQPHNPAQLCSIVRKKSHKRHDEPLLLSLSVGSSASSMQSGASCAAAPGSLPLMADDDFDETAAGSELANGSSSSSSNSSMAKELQRLRAESEANQTTMKRILEELAQSRNEQRLLQDEVYTLKRNFAALGGVAPERQAMSRLSLSSDASDERSSDASAHASVLLSSPVFAAPECALLSAVKTESPYASPLRIGFPNSDFYANLGSSTDDFGQFANPDELNLEDLNFAELLKTQTELP
eukprot:TRINITY_DN4450_c1_g2_i1.p1 TRINITY_DN4450_c1_g2~~TRINITY_DN4450_c1_g2_i1.p1  ORF type:complete len:373 (+),score=90.27 TRINITY_DN4450_c1_g2_i1:136-1119(+)